MTRRIASLGALAVAVAVTAGCGGAAKRSDPPTLVLWNRVGNVTLGESPKKLFADYGREGGYGYHIHGGLFDVESNFGTRYGINWIYFTTPYYRTASGFGVGSAFPRAWRSEFIWNPTLKVAPCQCWVKVGTGKRSLQPSVKTFGKPWVIVDMSRGKVSSILLSSKYVD